MGLGCFFGMMFGTGTSPSRFNLLSFFRMALLKEAAVHDVVTWDDDQSHWNVMFSRSHNDWNEEGICRFLVSGAKVKVLHEGIVEIPWPYHSKSSITVGSLS